MVLLIQLLLGGGSTTGMAATNLQTGLQFLDEVRVKDSSTENFGASNGGDRNKEPSPYPPPYPSYSKLVEELVAACVD